MVDENIIDELEHEIENLKEEELDLESLIRDGTSYRKPISVKLPNGAVGGAVIRPLTSSEWSNCGNRYLKQRGSMEQYVCEKGLLTKKEEPFPPELIRKMAAGTITVIAKEIMKISGIEADEEKERELRKELLDF